MQKLPGITREEEEQKLQKTISIAQHKLDAARQSARELSEELHEMLEVFDERDKEAMTLWHNTNSMFRQVNQDIKRAGQARKKPYFGRIDFRDKKLRKDEVYYIGRSAIAENPAEPEVIDWRAPIASVYYESGLGDATYSVKGEGSYEITLSRKRTYEIEHDALKAYYDSDIVANDDLLTKYLAKNKNAVLGDIIATIQQEQNEVIRKKPQHNLMIQGAAGSGKTTVAMHRISYILYNYELEFAPEDFYIIGSNQMLLNYITGVLPELNVYGVAQMTMEQLFVRLLYEDWDEKYTVKPVKKGITPPFKGTADWFHDLEDYCERYEQSVIPQEDVRLEHNGVVLLTREAIRHLLQQNAHLSRADKISKLTEHLIAKLENEIQGKYYSYPKEEKDRLMRFYKNYFGRREWKGSIFELYDTFLQEQIQKGFSIDLPGTDFDVYDLAALAYLYKRIKETEIIREAGHVVIDEAQDFGMMAYGALHYCLSKCTYTIMGDVSQNISLDYGLNDWSELQKLMLTDPWDYFGLLRKSYRNTVEISRFATDILYHGSFQIYPVEPIIRHGKEVRTTGCPDFQALLEETVSTVQNWLQAGYETIAIVCASAEEAEQVSAGLAGTIPLLPTRPDQMEFAEGVMVLSLEHTKGLEFDTVLLFDASEDNYPAGDGYVKRLYVAATRALHELVVLYQGTLTRLIAEPVPEEKKQQTAVQAAAPQRKTLAAKPEKTREEIFRERARDGEQEIERRNLYGPKRITVSPQTPDQGNSSGVLPSRPRLSRQGTLSDEFGKVPDNNRLRPEGHSRIDCAVRFVIKGKGYYDLCSSYSTLRIMPMAPDVIRISFAKSQDSAFPPRLTELAKQGTKYKVRENPNMIQFLTEKILVHVDKKTGVLSFYTPQGTLLLSERAKDPRQTGAGQTWVFFDWKKTEKLTARGISEWSSLKFTPSLARYISFGKNSDRIPALVSSAGYELLFPPRIRLLCCRIPMYGPYVSMEDSSVIDYYFKVH